MKGFFPKRFLINNEENIKTNTKHINTNPNEVIYKELFQQIPYNVAVIDRDYNIIEANQNFRDYFGKWRNRKCYSVYKKLDAPCKHCPAKEVFRKKKSVVFDAIGIDQHGRKTHYVAQVFPLRTSKSNRVDYLMEMSNTVTETDHWQQEYQILFDRVPCYITVIGEDYRIVRANEAFRNNFGDVLGEHCYKVYKRRKTKCPNCPAEKTFRDGSVHHSTQQGVSKSGEKIHYAVSTSALMKNGETVAHVIEISDDITELKKLENEIIDAERLAAVGQTVAGLAHSIKNLLMGLEGGKYIVSLGLKNNDKDKINQGWEMLERNFDKTTSLVKDFLSFSKGRLPVFKMVDPAWIVNEIIGLYKDVAARSSVELKASIDPKLKPAPLDADGIHTCLTNLVSNAIDACLMAEQKGTEVVINVSEGRDKLIFEVADNGSGMDYEIKKKIFTTFFTTKGGQGTGLGLLTTRKIVKEHGGNIKVISQKGKGARFRMEFPRKRLSALFKQSKNEILKQE